MEIMKNLKEDNLYVLQPVVEGDVIKVSDHPSMDGMNIIEFVEIENWIVVFLLIYIQYLCFFKIKSINKAKRRYK